MITGMTFRESSKPPPRWRKLLGPFSGLTLRQLIWVHFLWILFFWATAMLVFTPKAVEASLEQPILSIWTGITMLGTFTCMVGIIMSSKAPTTRAHVVGLSIELSGMFLTMVGPVVYCTTQIVLLATNVEKLDPAILVHQRLALSIFAYAMVASLMTRVAVLYNRWSKQVRATRTPIVLAREGKTER